MDIKVTRIGKEYHARLFDSNGTLLDEMSCKLKSSIGYICRTMLRWQDKMGNSNAWTRSARSRLQNDPVPNDISYHQKIF